MARAGTTERGTAVRAKIIPQAAEDVANVTMAGELGVSVPTVGLWRSPFQERGLFGLVDGPGTGRPAIYGREIRERIVATTLTLPKGSTHWSTPSVGQRDRGEPEDDPADLAGGLPPAASDRDVHVQPRSRARSQCDRRRRARPQPALAGDRSVGRRGVPDPRARSDAADVPPARAGRTPHPRLQGQRPRSPCRPHSRSQPDPDLGPAPSCRIPRPPQPPRPDLSAPPDPRRPRQCVDATRSPVSRNGSPVTSASGAGH
jgi:hypothetical protein